MINLLALIIFTLFFAIDIYFDLKSGIEISHVWHELTLCLIAVLNLAWQMRIILKKETHIKRLNIQLLEANKSYLEWKEKSQGNSKVVSQLIDNQFNTWQLSPSEKDVALLLIKGLSMKEVADIRSTHEKTVRQQATSIYRKSNLSGRQELAAFFLEDILTTTPS